MDLISIAEWSRFVVGCALFIYLGVWLAFISEMGLRLRLKRATASATTGATPDLVAVGTGASAVAAESSGDARSGAAEGGEQDAPDGPEAAGDSADLRGYLAEQADVRYRMGRTLLLVATAVLAVGVAMRGIGTERVPWGNMHEFSITAALVASVAFIFVGRTAAGRAVASWGILLVFVTLGLAVTYLYVPPGPLPPALESYWLVIHVGCAVLAFGLFTVAAVVNILQILAERAERRGATGGFVGLLPTSSVLDRLGYRLAAAGFPIWTIGPLILGAVWAEVSWGRFWGWDPKEVWALITWLVYAAYLHARATAGWKGSKASTVALIGYGTAIFSYFGVNIFFEGLHAYGGL
ncbi:c-type cytochrome biogenesis protein CcsB [Phytoactinopolyspora halotolerans]|uniref:C-type cytochrome biogenesis protein CcsB n=1 Tax=Phytoactinopolyspora halotolerans TaxID=1981512 RepID=A0A6L9S6Y7_9ACTN|nr:c-type cytochrome biogenesis protein CcsB [Phytoactinopolyspora halotolerans]NEE00322.1 c-type cytochrome biogenesis protein CcsB [Phytoactinopolyspora halotolerans]